MVAIVELTGLDGAPVAVASGEVDDLAARIDGGILRAGDAGWDEATLVWNGMVARIPALVVQPVSVQDVVTAVAFARTHDLALGIKGGGHHIAGTAMVAGGLTLDMSRMRTVDIDVDARLVHVGPGCLLKHVDVAAQEHGLATVLGFVSETGVAGLTLGGGFGYLTRRFGWTVDNLEQVEVVTADGRVRTASRDEEPELFWALRGGGGNFGIVTRFTFRLHEVGPMIRGGLIVWSGDRAADVLDTFEELTSTSSRELTAAVTLRLAPPAPFLPSEWHGKPIAGIVVCHSGSDPTSDLEPLRRLGEPIADVIADKPYSAQQSMLDATQPKGLHYYWKSEFLPGLSGGVKDAVRDAAQRITSPKSQTIMFHLGDAVAERADDDGAVGNRDARYVGAVAACWEPTGTADLHISWAQDAWKTLRPFSTGGNYVNFQVDEHDPQRIADAYRGNLPRLQRAKATYDPGNLFRHNRNIAPVAG